jgi:hypothetical protein
VREIIYVPLPIVKKIIGRNIEGLRIIQERQMRFGKARESISGA